WYNHHSAAAPATVLVLVVVRDQAVEDAHAPAGRPGWLKRAVVPGTPRGASDIKVGPGATIVDEALQELCGRDRTGIARRADILHVGDVAVELLVVARPERQAPHRLGFGLAGSINLLRQVVIVGEHPGVL